MAKNNKTKESDSFEEKEVKKTDLVTVYSTGQSKHLGKQGKPYKVHSVVADKLVEKGHATANKPE